MSRVRFVVACALAALSAGAAWSQSPPGPKPGALTAEDNAQLIRRNTSTFLAYSSEKTDKLRAMLKRGERDEALLLEEKFHQEECRFLERMIWCCRQDRSFKEAATGLQAYLDGYRGLTPEQSLKEREGNLFGMPKSFSVVMSHLDKVSGGASPAPAGGASAAPAAEAPKAEPSPAPVPAPSEAPSASPSSAPASPATSAPLPDSTASPGSSAGSPGSPEASPSVRSQ